MTDQNERREYIARARAIRRISHPIESSYLPRDLTDDLQRLIKEALMWEMGQAVVRRGVALIEQMVEETSGSSDADAWTSKLPPLQRRLNQAHEMLRLFNQIKSGEADDQA